jgi:hypothetical protein
MGVGYVVSPLHRIIHMDVSAMTTRPPVKGSNSPIDRTAELMGTEVGVGSPRLHSPSIDEILAWRRAIVDTQPSVARAYAADTSDKILGAAWQTSNTIWRLATLAVAKGLPLWTTG